MGSGERVRIVIFGSRTLVPPHVVRAYVASLPADTVVITGGNLGPHMGGVDWIACVAALERGLAVEIYPAQWDSLGKAAGPIRNELMARLCDVGQMFRGPIRQRSGTDDMFERLQRLGRPCGTWRAA